MAYYTEAELLDMGFKCLGKNVKISKKASIYNANQIEIGDNSRIDDFCVISGTIKIGKFVHIAPLSLIAGGEKGVFMDDFSGLAYHVSVFSQSDDYLGRTLTNPTVPNKYKREKREAVHLSRHVIVGANSVILPGVTIAEGCSIGAMSLIKRSTEPWGVYAGNPAKRILERRRNLLDLEKQFLDELSNAAI